MRTVNILYVLYTVRHVESLFDEILLTVTSNTTAWNRAQPSSVSLLPSCSWLLIDVINLPDDMVWIPVERGKESMPDNKGG